MLSRIAVALYLFGRHLERAEQLARTLRVHNELFLDRGVLGDHRFWPRFMELAGWPVVDQLSRHQAIELTLTGAAGPSVRRAVGDARTAALAVRPSLSSDVFEQINGLHWRLQENGRPRGLDAYLRGVELGVHLISGLVDETMTHDEAWDFIRLGKLLGRAAATTALLLRKCEDLAGVEDATDDWAAILRSCSSFEAYQQHVPAPATADRVIRFLLLYPLSPRSAAFCIRQCLTAVAHIDRHGELGPPHRALERLAGLLEEAGPAEVAAAPAAFATQFEELRQAVESALREVYFLPSSLAVSMSGDGLVAHPHQQQQRRLCASR